MAVLTGSYSDVTMMKMMMLMMMMMMMMMNIDDDDDDDDELTIMKMMLIKWNIGSVRLFLGFVVDEKGALLGDGFCMVAHCCSQMPLDGAT